MKYCFIFLFAIFLNGIVNSSHTNRFDSLYEKNKEILIKQNNYETDEQLYDIICSDFGMKILGTLTSQDCSILND